MESRDNRYGNQCGNYRINSSHGSYGNRGGNNYSHRDVETGYRESYSNREMYLNPNFLQNDNSLQERWIQEEERKNAKRERERHNEGMPSGKRARGGDEEKGTRNNNRFGAIYAFLHGNGLMEERNGKKQLVTDRVRIVGELCVRDGMPHNKFHIFFSSAIGALESQFESSGVYNLKFSFGKLAFQTMLKAVAIAFGDKTFSFYDIDRKLFKSYLKIVNMYLDACAVKNIRLKERLLPFSYFCKKNLVEVLKGDKDNELMGLFLTSLNHVFEGSRAGLIYCKLFKRIDTRWVLSIVSVLWIFVIGNLRDGRVNLNEERVINIVNLINASLTGEGKEYINKTSFSVDQVFEVMERVMEKIEEPNPKTHYTVLHRIEVILQEMLGDLVDGRDIANILRYSEGRSVIRKLTRFMAYEVKFLLRAEDKKIASSSKGILAQFYKLNKMINSIPKEEQIDLNKLDEEEVVEDPETSYNEAVKRMQEFIKKEYDEIVKIVNENIKQDLLQE